MPLGSSQHNPKTLTLYIMQLARGANVARSEIRQQCSPGTPNTCNVHVLFVVLQYTLFQVLREGSGVLIVQSDLTHILFRRSALCNSGISYAEVTSKTIPTTLLTTLLQPCHLTPQRRIALGERERRLNSSQLAAMALFCSTLQPNARSQPFPLRRSSGLSKALQYPNGSFSLSY